MATDGVRMLTVRQPWAWAIIHGGKDVENRRWPTKHRGALLIHAGSAFERDWYETVERLAARPPPPSDEFVHGAIIGVAELVDCVRDSNSEWAVRGQWHWCLRNQGRLKPFPAPASSACGGRHLASLLEPATKGAG